MYQQITKGRLIQPVSVSTVTGDQTFYEYPLSGYYEQEIEKEGTYVPEQTYEGVFEE